jgi:Fe-S-cluster-containing hydrogenase component 2
MKQIILKDNRCDFCGTCVAVCPQDAINLNEAQWQVIAERCTVCGFCANVCPLEALEVQDE